MTLFASPADHAASPWFATASGRIGRIAIPWRRICIGRSAARSVVRGQAVRVRAARVASDQRRGNRSAGAAGGGSLARSATTRTREDRPRCSPSPVRRSPRGTDCTASSTARSPSPVWSMSTVEQFDASRHGWVIWDLLVFEPWFLIEGVLFAGVGWAATPPSSRRTWIIACSTAITLSVVTGLVGVRV